MHKLLTSVIATEPKICSNFNYTGDFISKRGIYCITMVNWAKIKKKLELSQEMCRSWSQTLDPWEELKRPASLTTVPQVLDRKQMQVACT